MVTRPRYIGIMVRIPEDTQTELRELATRTRADADAGPLWVHATEQDATASWRPFVASVVRMLETVATLARLTRESAAEPSFTRSTARLIESPARKPLVVIACWPYVLTVTFTADEFATETDDARRLDRMCAALVAEVHRAVVELHPNDPPDRTTCTPAPSPGT